MTAFVNPALRKLVALISGELEFVQVLIRRTARGFELRHVEDRAAAADALLLTPLAELRALAQCSVGGAFRPLKSAPNLKSRWRAVAADEAELETALNTLYPGAVADWFAALAEPAPVTNFREFMERQTGMYRVAAMLDDTQAARVIRACCDRRFCLKCRLWSVAGLAPDTSAQKSVVPCLEPCAVLLELARKAMRLEQEERVRIELAAEELAAVVEALQALPKREVNDGGREADFSSPTNPRRVQLILEKLAAARATAGSPE